MSIGKHAPSPSNVVLLHDLSEIRALWGIGEDRVYRAVANGLLHAYGRPGRQKYYSSLELIRAFGEPLTSPIPPALKRRDNRSDATGGQYSQGELALTSRAA
jgi:hypothetical protein